jgi:putative nucleotidyltransferase with HDIG domain
MTNTEKDYPDESLVFEPIRMEKPIRVEAEGEVAPKKKARPGSRAMELYREWLGLPTRIRAQAPVARHNVGRVQQGLILYRLILLKFKFYAINVDTEIWTTYRWILAEVQRLGTKTKGRRLRFRRLAYLRELLQEWQTLIARESDLLVSIEKAPASFEFYNKMMTFQELHRVERRESEETSQKYSRAYDGLESAIQYVEKFNSENDLSIFGASVLRVADARAYWDERLNAIRGMEARGDDPDRTTAEINHLKDVMFESPALAKWVHDIEQRFTRLVYDHELLVDSFGKAVIPEAELREHQTIHSEALPRLWATGQRKQLEESIHLLERFVATYEGQVDSELSFAERHSLRRSGGGEATGVSQTQGLQQMADLTRILVSAMEAREPAMPNHSITVAKYAVEIGRQMNWREEDVRYLELAALLHDVGKIWIPESVLNKDGALTAQDTAELRKHPLYGAQILESFDSLKDIAPWIYYHQERWDGAGYPEGLSGEDIPIAARIIAVAEAYSAMVSGSASRRPMTAEGALMELQTEAGLAFDPHVVEVFVKATRASGSQ